MLAFQLYSIYLKIDHIQVAVLTAIQSGVSKIYAPLYGGNVAQIYPTSFDYTDPNIVTIHDSGVFNFSFTDVRKASTNTYTSLINEALDLSDELKYARVVYVDYIINVSSSSGGMITDSYDSHVYFINYGAYYSTSTSKTHWAAATININSQRPSLNMRSLYRWNDNILTRATVSSTNNTFTSGANYRPCIGLFPNSSAGSAAGTCRIIVSAVF